MPSQSHLDAALIADCAAFDVLERAVYVTCLGDDCPVKEAEGEQLYQQQLPIVARICAAPARTIEGLQAKTRSLALWDEFAIDPDPACIHDRLRTSLLTDLLAMPGRAA